MRFGKSTEIKTTEHLWYRWTEWARKREPNKSAYTKYMSNYILQHLISLLRTFKTGCGCWCCCCWYTYVCREYVISQIVCYSDEMRQINNAVSFFFGSPSVHWNIRKRLSMLICFQLLNKSTRFYSHAMCYFHFHKCLHIQFGSRSIWPMFIHSGFFFSFYRFL